MRGSPSARLEQSCQALWRFVGGGAPVSRPGAPAWGAGLMPPMPVWLGYAATPVSGVLLVVALFLVARMRRAWGAGALRRAYGWGLAGLICGITAALTGVNCAFIDIDAGLSQLQFPFLALAPAYAGHPGLGPGSLALLIIVTATLVALAVLFPLIWGCSRVRLWWPEKLDSLDRWPRCQRAHQIARALGRALCALGAALRWVARLATRLVIWPLRALADWVER